MSYQGHLTDRFGEHTDLVARELCWLTDRTPHMALPVVKGTHRQFFRLVTKGVNVWYAKHSTPNPLGIVPPESVRIIEADLGDAFPQITHAGYNLTQRDESCQLQKTGAWVGTAKKVQIFFFVLKEIFVVQK